MRSATSFFNKTLFRNQLLRTWPLWLAYTAVWLFIVPITLLTQMSARQGLYTAEDAIDLLLSTGAHDGIYITFGFGLLFAMLSFSYLTKGRATNGYHALPMRRETLFSTVYLTGLFCQITSILLAFLFAAAVTAPLHLDFWGVIGSAALAAMLETVFYYSFAVLCVMMTGQMLAAPAFYVIGNFLASGMESLVMSFAGNFLYGYTASGTTHLSFLSPFIWMNRRVNVNCDYSYIDETGETLVTNAYLDPDSLALLIAYALAGLAIAVIAMLLYRTRKSELTGSTVAFPWAVPVFKYGVAFCTAIAIGQMLYYLLFGQYQVGGHYSLPGTIACMLAAGLAGYYIAEMLIRKSFRVFREGAKGAAIVAGILVLLGITMTFDLTGYEDRIPNENDIESVSYSFGGRTQVATQDPDTIRYLLAAHRAIVDNKDDQLRRVNGPISIDTDSNTGRVGFSLEFTYYLENGMQLTRDYTVYLREGDLPDPASVTGRVNTLYMCPESAKRRILGYNYDDISNALNILDSYCTYYGESGTVDYSLTAGQAQKVYDALLQDAENVGGSSGNIFTVQEYASGGITYSLELYFETVNENGRPVVDSLYTDVNENTPHTLETLDALRPTLSTASYEVSEPVDDSIVNLPTDGTEAGDAETIPADDAGSAEGVN